MIEFLELAVQREIVAEIDAMHHETAQISLNAEATLVSELPAFVD